MRDVFRFVYPRMFGFDLANDTSDEKRPNGGGLT